MPRRILTTYCLLLRNQLKSPNIIKLSYLFMYLFNVSSTFFIYCDRRGEGGGMLPSLKVYTCWKNCVLSDFFHFLSDYYKYKYLN